jgi:ribosome recycling factor
MTSQEILNYLEHERHIYLPIRISREELAKDYNKTFTDKEWEENVENWHDIYFQELADNAYDEILDITEDDEDQE